MFEWIKTAMRSGFAPGLEAYRASDCELDFGGKLNRGRSAAGVVEGNFVPRGSTDGARFMPAGDFGRKN